MDVFDVLGDLLIDIEKTVASSSSPKLKEAYSSSPMKPLKVETNKSTMDKNLLIVPPAVEPSFLYSPDRDIITGQPIMRTQSPAPLSPMLLSSPRPNSALRSEPEAQTFSVNDANEDWKFQSYHLDYKYTPPPIKGPCCVCGDGIMGAMVTALDQMWHPEHFCCVHCGVELRSPMYTENDGKPYCKICHGKLFLPPCAECKKNITGAYVNAMNKIWHPDCFKCTKCRKVLTPTTFFQKEGKPYCEDDFHDLFSPKCAACKTPIKDDRKISVMGRHWHPEHFKCCQCGCQLTPTNFKEKNGKLYCEKDFNDLFMPKCGGCNTPVLSSQNPTTAMGKTWHPHCFTCTECKKQLSPDKFFEKDGKPYCEDDFHKLFSPKCAGCHKPIKDTKKMITAQGKTFHPEHFNCTECGKVLSPKNFFEKDGLPYCEDDFHKLFSPKCAGCGQPIKDQNKMVTALGKVFHPEHFNCTECGKVLSPKNFFENDGLPYCEDDFHKLFSAKCAGCGQPIKDPKNMVTAQGKTFHPEHFNCTECGKVLSPKNFFEKDGLPYCEDDFHKLFSPKCTGCGQPIKDLNKMVTALGKTYHPEHFTCHKCGKTLKENDFFEKDGKVYCLDDFLNLFGPKCCSCRQPIKDDYCLVALEGDWHSDCFKCKDCNCLLEDKNFFEIDGEPYCEQHFHERQCPDCIKMRRAQNKYFGIPTTAPMQPSRWASQVSLKSLEIGQGQQTRPLSGMSQFSTTSYDTAYSGGRSSPNPSIRSYVIPIEREGERSRVSNGDVHVHGDACNHAHDISQKEHVHDLRHTQDYRVSQEQSQRSSMKRGLGDSKDLSRSQHSLQYIARNENPYNYIEPGKFPVEPKHIRFSDTVMKKEFATDAKYY